MMLRKCIRSLLYFGVLLMALSPASGAAQSPGTLRVGLLTTPESIDPALAQDDVSRLLVEQLFLGLVEVDETGQVFPALADSWEVSDDGLVWTFYLRQGITWVDAYGNRQADVYADDVISSMDRAFEIGTAAGDLQIIEAWEKIDDYTIRFYLSEAAEYFPAILSLPAARPVPMQIVDAYGETWTTPETIWNNGPYLLGQWDGNFIQLTRNPYWWGADEVYFEEVQITTGLDVQEAIERYREGEFDLIELHRGVYPQVAGDPGLAAELYTPPDTRTYYLAKPYLEPRFRMDTGLGPFHEWWAREVVGEPTVEPEVSIPRTTKVMDQETFDALVSISEDHAVFTFARMTGQLAALVPGDILVGDQVRRDLAPFGFLRRVNNTYISGDQVIVETDQAMLDEAIELGEMGFSMDLEMENVMAARLRDGVSVTKVDASPLREGFSLKIDEILIDDDGDEVNTTNDQIRVKGSINLDPDVDIRLRIEGHELKYLEYSHTTNEQARLDLVTGINIIDVHPRVEIAHYVFMPQTIWIGWVPVVVTPEMSVYVGLDGNVSVGISTGIEQEATFKTGVIYEDGNWTPFEEFANDFGYTPPTLKENCSAKAYLGPEISLMLYGVTGPYGRLQGYLRLVANPGDEPWWELYAGVGANIGVKVKVLSHVVASYEETLIDYEELLAQADTDFVVTPPETPTPGPTTDCTSGLWPPKCWRWWVWVILIIIVLLIIAFLVG